MQTISSKNAAIMEVRRRTGAPISGCKIAIESCNGDVDEACLTIARAVHEEQAGGKHDSYGLVCHYSHNFGRVGVMVEITCESSYVAKNREFIKLANAIAVHIAWSNPKYISRSELDIRDIESAKENFTATMESGAALAARGHYDVQFGAEYLSRLVNDSMERYYYPGLCLLDQKEMSESGGDKTVGQLLRELSDKVREKIEVKWFARREIGK